jgi:hypothetical protein
MTERPKNQNAVALGRLGGLASANSITEAKRAAARINGRKSKGRPKTRKPKVSAPNTEH